MEHKWEKCSPEMTKVLEDALLRFTCDRKPMFGSPVFWINRNMFAGVFEDSIFIRLSEKDRTDIAAKHPGAHPFEPLKGRVMREYMVVPGSLISDKETFGLWLEKAHSYAASLPPKVKKPKK